MFRLLFVCTGNICRSPTAEALLRHHAQQAGLTHALSIDSAGTHDYHIGEPPDSRTIAVAKRFGVDMTMLRARQVSAQDFHGQNLILAMDNSHLRWLEHKKPQNAAANIGLMLPYCGSDEQDVADPYYKDNRAFEQVFHQLDAAMPQLLTRLKPQLA